MDYGLLSGLAEGIKQGFLSYNDVRRRNLEEQRYEEQKKQNQALFKLGLLKEGYQQTPEGEFSLTPEEQQKRQLEQVLKKRKSVIDSAEAEAEAKLAEAGMEAIKDQEGNIVGTKKSSSGLLSPKKYMEQLQLKKLEQEVGGSQGAFKGLPEENKKQIDVLAQKTANKKSINNQIKASLATLEDPRISKEQKIVQGRQLLKVLNSSEGADAVGAEEARRLGGLLEYHFGNLTEPGPFIGRDLKGFTEQVRNTSRNLENSIKMNESDVENLYGKKHKSGLVGGETKIIGGKTYKKVQGGWEEI